LICLLIIGKVRKLNIDMQRNTDQVLVKKELKPQFLKADPNKLYVETRHPYWFMENLGLKNFQ